jgi:hypothetical protein
MLKIYASLLPFLDQDTKLESEKGYNRFNLQQLNLRRKNSKCGAENSKLSQGRRKDS